MLELKSLLKIKSAIRASYAKNKVATVIHSGDDDNGSILLKIRRKDSKSCLMGKSLSNDGSYSWSLLSGCKNEWQEEEAYSVCDIHNKRWLLPRWRCGVNEV